MRASSDNAELKLRMKEPLRARIEAAAAERGGSMNAEMVSRLERTLRDDEIAVRLDRIEELLKRLVP